MIIINTRKLWTTGFAILTTIAILTVTYITYGPLGIATLIATIFSITILPILTGLAYYKLKRKIRNKTRNKLKPKEKITQIIK